MVHLYRLIKCAVLALLLAPLFATAAVPPVTEYQIYVGNTTIGGWSSSLSGACGNAASYQISNQTSPQCTYGTVYCTFTPVVQDGACYVRRDPSGMMQLWGHQTRQVCPIGSASVNGQCQCLSPLVETGAGECKLPACPVGQHEEGGACVPDNCTGEQTRVNGICVDPPPCPAGQVRVAGKCKVPDKCPKPGIMAGEYRVKNTTPTSMCEAGCVVSITSFVRAVKDGSVVETVGIGYYSGSECNGPSELSLPLKSGVLSPC